MTQTIQAGMCNVGSNTSWAQAGSTVKSSLCGQEVVSHWDQVLSSQLIVDI